MTPLHCVHAVLCWSLELVIDSLSGVQLLTVWPWLLMASSVGRLGVERLLDVLRLIHAVKDSRTAGPTVIWRADQPIG